MAAQSLSHAAPNGAQNSSGSDFLGKMSSFSTKWAKDSGLGSTLGTLIAGVRTILPTAQSLPITRITESIMNGTLTSGATGGTSLVLGGGSGSAVMEEDYVFLDPRVSTRIGDGGRPPVKASRNMVFQEGYVFVVGGGNYVEYQALQEWAQVR